ncbi:MAG: HEAT repeat domain-containing protein [Acidobacteriia bacterium]|nr:HEAT repeat domain-containing protein [Terriglobia bacterium]
MNCEESKMLLADYWAQTLSETKELEFDAHIATCDLCRTDAERLGALWTSLSKIPAEEPSPALRTRFYDTLAAYRHGLEAAPRASWKERILALWPRQPAFQMGLSFALLAIGVGIGYTARPGVKPVEPETQEVAALRGEVTNMRQMVALSLLQQQSASERLRGVSYAVQVPSSDTEVLSALLKTVNQDANVNVRLQAVDALHQFGASPVTRTAVAQSIGKQDTPLVQIALIDLLVDLKDKDSAPELMKVSSDEKIDAAVRQHAKWALGKLQ